VATYADTAEIYCTDTDKTLTGEILTFKPEKVLSVALVRQIKLTLMWDDKIKVYVGNGQGLEFQSQGPAMLSERNY